MAALQFYEREAAQNKWNKQQLERQINTLLFECLLKSCGVGRGVQLHSDVTVMLTLRYETLDLDEGAPVTCSIHTESGAYPHP